MSSSSNIYLKEKHYKAELVTFISQAFPEISVETCADILEAVNWEAEKAVLMLGGDVSNSNPNLTNVEEKAAQNAEISSSRASSLERNQLDYRTALAKTERVQCSSETQTPTQNSFLTVSKSTNVSNNSCSTSSSSANNSSLINIRHIPNGANKKLLDELLRSELLNGERRELLNAAYSGTGRNLIIMRGVSGSGKSSLAKLYLSLSPSGAIVSADDFFTSPNGTYNFNAQDLSQAHQNSQLNCEKHMKKQVPLLIVDNTNTQEWEMLPYAKLAIENNYKIRIVEPNTAWKYSANMLAAKNTHNVTKTNIVKMLSRYEKDVTVEKLIQSAISKNHHLRKMYLKNKMCVTEEKSEEIGALQENLINKSNSNYSRSSCDLVKEISSKLVEKRAKSASNSSSDTKLNYSRSSCDLIEEISSKLTMSEKSTQSANNSSNDAKLGKISKSELSNISNISPHESESDKSSYFDFNHLKTELNSVQKCPVDESSSNNPSSETSDDAKAQEIIDEKEDKIMEENEGASILLNIFPSVSREDLADIYSRCHGDLNWCSELLLESGYELYENSSTSKTELLNECSQNNNLDSNSNSSIRAISITNQNECLEEMDIDKKEVPEKSDSFKNLAPLTSTVTPIHNNCIDADDKKNTIESNSSPATSTITPITQNKCTEKEDRKVTIINLAPLVRAGILIPNKRLDDKKYANSKNLAPSSTASYTQNKNINDNNFLSNFSSPQIATTSSSQHEILDSKISDSVNNNNSNCSKLVSKSSEFLPDLFEAIDGDDWMELCLPQEFLSSLFSTFPTPYPESSSLPLASKIKIPPSLAFELYKYVCLNLLNEDCKKGEEEERGKEEDLTHREVVESLEEMDRVTNEVGSVNLKKLMELETVLSRHESLRVQKLRSSLSPHVSVKLSLSSIKELFPTVDEREIVDIYALSGENYKETVRILKAKYPSKNNLGNGSGQKLKDEGEEHDVQFKAKEIMSISDWRTKATTHSRKMINFRQQMFENRNNPQVADYYRKMLHQEKALMDYSNKEAYKLITSTSSSLDKEVDLHFLRLDEAMSLLQLFLNEWKERLKAGSHSGHKFIEFKIITGRGNNSILGPKIMPAVLTYLRNQNYSYDVRLGYVIVKLELPLS